MSAMLAWLSALPEMLLYTAIAAAAFAENLFPPLPADTVIALGAFVAAQGSGSLVGVWTATMIGNLGGALLMYELGRRFGLPWLARRVPAIGSPEAAEALAARYATQGMTAVIISRFLPAVRALVPPVAGAIGLGAFRAGLAMFTASGIWYGLIAVLAFRAGANAEAVLSRIAAQQRVLGLLALGLVLVFGAIWWWRSRAYRRRRTDG